MLLAGCGDKTPGSPVEPGDRPNSDVYAVRYDEIDQNDTHISVDATVESTTTITLEEPLVDPRAINRQVPSRSSLLRKAGTLRAATIRRTGFV